ncbi:MAG: hypothetical protein ACM3ZB_11595 [bacterium]|jgi:hypothetical protein
MKIILAGLAFGAAFILALIALYAFRARWYWHALSAVVGLALGLTPFPDGFRPPDHLTGFLFVLLTVWGLGVVFMYPYRRRRKAHQA